MAKIQSAKDIFTSYDLLAGEDTKRHPKHEFQAYAYRLASDLNDVDNLHIYMRLAKNVNRSLLEQAYSYAIDSSSSEKQRVFLWKVKQIREHVKKKKIMSSFDYKTIIDHTITVRNAFATQIIAKQEKQFWDNDGRAFSFLLPKVLKNKEKYNVLVIGLESLSLLDILMLYPVRLFGIDWSREIVNEAKEHITGTKISPKPKLIGKRFMDNTYDDKCFDLIIINTCWQYIPGNFELTFLQELQRILAKSGKIIIGVSQAKASKQAWNTLQDNNFEYLYFKKEQAEKDLFKVLFKHQLEAKQRFEGYKKSWYVI